MNLISKEEFYIRYYDYNKIINKNKKVLEIQGYKKLVGFNIQSGGFLITINDVTDREDHYHFMMELKENGEIKDYTALSLGKVKHEGSGVDKEGGSWYRLEPVHNYSLTHKPLVVLHYEVGHMKLFGEMVCKYARRVWDI